MKKKNKISRIHHLEFGELNLEVRQHFLERWNERIEKGKTSEEIVKYIKGLSRVKWGIYREHKDLYVLDGDIVIIAFKSGNSIQLVTVLGRKSMIPALSDLRYYNEINFVYGKVDLQNKTI